jgi:signal transduction histidine kinase
MNFKFLSAHLLPLVLFFMALALAVVSIRIVLNQGAGILSNLLPILSGLLLALSGIWNYFYLFPKPGLRPLLLFFFFAGSFLSLYPAWNSCQALAYLALLCLALLPPTLNHSTLFLSEVFVDQKKIKLLYVLPYIISGILIFPYYYFFIVQSPHRAIFTSAYLLLLVLAYLFWIGRLLKIIKNPHLELDRLQARHLLKGQINGWILPCIVLSALFLGGIRLSIGFLSPFFLLFPVSLLMGLIPSQRQQRDTYIVQSEKRSTFSNLTAGLAHELNNPMTFIHSNLEPIREHLAKLKEYFPEPDEKVGKIFGKLDRMLNHVEDGVERTRALIDNFRQFPNQRTEQKEAVELQEILEESIKLLGHKWRDKVQIDKKYETIPRIQGYRTELVQVFTNLLSNAFDAVGESGKVAVSTKKGAGGVKVSISNTGEGIPIADIGKIFDPFYTTKKQGKGTGLGLSIALQLTMNNKGSIEVKSKAEEGTEFIVFFPA